MSRFMVGVDVGGTFTDFVTYDRDSASVEVRKNLSTPADPTEGILAGLAGVEPAAAIANIRLGTTVATNAILERKGARIAYLTTRGFRDIPFLQRGNRQFHYDSGWVKPKPLVKRRDSFEIVERVLSDGSVEQALDEDSVRAAARDIAAAGGIEAIAVNLLFSYVNPTHELRVREILAEVLAEVPVSISYEVLPKWKEYERASTTLADAYIKPVLHRHLRDIRARLDACGIRAQVAMIKSNGGEMTIEAARQQPIHLTLSGPTGGVVAAQKIAGELGIDNIATLDMGGTSTDCSTIAGRKINFTTDFEIEFGVPIQIPMIDIRTIGAGGGSVAWIDKGGMLRVGPRSAGANPGPACYGFGGTEPTATDANVVLGRINPRNFLGGAMQLAPANAEQAIAGLAGALGMAPEETALAILRIVNNNMAGMLRTVLTERGLDPRDFTLCGFGGAGPLHISGLMEEAGIPSAVVPIHPGQFSALGFILTDARVDLERTVQMTSQRFDMDRATATLAALIEAGTQNLLDQGYPSDVQISRTLELRYLGQNYELEVPLDFSEFTPARTTRTWENFHALHEARFGFHIPRETIEIITIKCTVISVTEKPQFPALAQTNRAPVPRHERRVVFDDGPRNAPVFDRADLTRGAIIEGPAIIEEAASVTVLGSAQRLEVSPQGHLLMATRGAESAT